MATMAVTPLSQFKGVLLDIEGTTTPISFVHDVLFPYARSHLQEHLSANWEPSDAALQALLGRADELLDEEARSGNPQSVVVRVVHALMDRDEKYGPLKELQGKIWKRGYDSGELFGLVFPDVLPAIRHWRSLQLRVCIYSSGSVSAQKLLFGHIEPSALLPGEDVLALFSGFFDTSVGSKVEAGSYLRISQQLQLNPADILFLTDRPVEARAAQQAGVTAMIVTRLGNAVLTDEERSSWTVLSSFAQLE